MTENKEWFLDQVYSLHIQRSQELKEAWTLKEKYNKKIKEYSPMIENLKAQMIKIRNGIDLAETESQISYKNENAKHAKQAKQLEVQVYELKILHTKLLAQKEAMINELQCLKRIVDGHFDQAKNLKELSIIYCSNLPSVDTLKNSPYLSL